MKDHSLRALKVGDIYRYSSSFDPSTEVIDGLPNLIHITSTPGKNKVLMEAGISPIGSKGNCPAILISSSVHKHGSKETPWQDEFDVDQGFARYFGDNKSSLDPSKSNGNKALLEQFALHKSGLAEMRSLAAPILLFKSVQVGTRIKGNRIFQGVALINSAERVSQYQKDIGYFTNYVFEFTVLNLVEENDYFNWDWISARRDISLSPEETLKLAPKSWKQWVESGDMNSPKLRRKVSRFLTVPRIEQVPMKGSREEKCLKDIYKHYQRHRQGFELLASKVVSSHISRSGGKYLDGWVTRGSGDGGVDFVGRLDIGSGFSKVKVIVLGQAKCEDPEKPTNGVHISRTVSRLKRGWIGAYVTTSFFSEPMQREIIEDRYPLLTINGSILAQEVLILVESSGLQSVSSYLERLDTEYPSWISSRAPEDILVE